MDLPDLVNHLNTLQRVSSLNFLLESNQYSEKYGLVLTPQDAQDLIHARNRLLAELGRVETDLSIVVKIIQAFSSSPYLNSSEYLSTITDLVQTFYLIKNNSKDKISDDDLVSLMQYFFNGSCRGSVDLLRERELAAFVRIFLRAEQEIGYRRGGSE